MESCLKDSRHITIKRPSKVLPIKAPSPWRPEFLFMQPSLSYLSRALTPSWVLQTIASIVFNPRYSDKSLHSNQYSKACAFIVTYFLIFKQEISNTGNKIIFHILIAMDSKDTRAVSTGWNKCKVLQAKGKYADGTYLLRLSSSTFPSVATIPTTSFVNVRLEAWAPRRDLSRPKKPAAEFSCRSSICSFISSLVGCELSPLQILGVLEDWYFSIRPMNRLKLKFTHMKLALH